MRILFVAPEPFFQPRGTPIAARRLLQFLSEQGHEVDVLTYDEGEDVRLPRCRLHRIPHIPGVRAIPPGFSWGKIANDIVLFAYCLLLARRHYDLVHAVEESVFMATVLKWVFGTPFVYDMDSSLAEQMVEQFPILQRIRPALRLCERVAVRESLGVLTVCRSLETTASRYDPAKLVACVEDQSLLEYGDAPESLRDLAGRGTALALYAGNLRPYQGIDLLLHGFVHTLEELPGSRLMLIGGTDLRIAHYRGMAESLGIGTAVWFLGPRPIEHLHGYLRQADVLVSPRVSGINTPMKIYSYLDSGTAILATRLPTHTQVLDDAVALLVEPTPELFGRALARLLADATLRRALASRAKQRATDEFSPEAARRKLRRFYSRLEHKLAGMT